MNASTIRSQCYARAALGLARARLWPRHSALLLLVILAAFLGQSIAIQSHVHFAAEAAQSTAATPSGQSQIASAAKKNRGDSPADCPLCRELALSGHYLMPAPVELAAPILAAFGIFVAPVMALAWRGRSHSWRSRAPPR